MSTRRALTPEDVAQLLVSRRDELVEQLPGQIRVARALSHHQREFVIDDSLTWLVTEYTGDIASETDAEGLLWGAAAKRVKGTLSGRYDTVRGGFARTSVDAADGAQIASENDPHEATERALEESVLAEFVASLDSTERAVFQRKWRPGLRDPAGWRVIARELNMAAGQVRAAERSIGDKLATFTGAYTLGGLCDQRSAELAEAAQAGTLAQLPAARAHMAHCSTCKLAYAAQLRAIKTGELPRKIAALLPVPTIAGDRDSRVRELLSDLAARLTSNDTANTIASVASSGVGRGSGAIAVIKIAAVFAATTGAGVGVGISTGVIDTRSETKQAVIATPTPAATSTPPPVVSAADEEALQRAIDRTRARVRAASERRRARARRRAQRRAAQEQDVPISPAPQGALPQGDSEFTPDGAALPPAPPAPAPTAPGASEFGP